MRSARNGSMSCIVVMSKVLICSRPRARYAFALSVVVVSAREHPDVLNGRRVEHVVEIDEVRIVSIPQNISGVAIPVEQNVLDVLETRSNGVANLRYDRLESTCEFHRNEVSVFQKLQRVSPISLGIKP